jgi:hypothetical protein
MSTAVVAGLDRATQYSKGSSADLWRLGVLDPPLSLGMTTGVTVHNLQS